MHLFIKSSFYMKLVTFFSLQESKRSFLHSVVNEGGDKEKLECFVNFCEDTIFEVITCAPVLLRELTSYFFFFLSQHSHNTINGVLLYCPVIRLKSFMLIIIGPNKLMLLCNDTQCKKTALMAYQGNEWPDQPVYQQWMPRPACASNISTN